MPRTSEADLLANGGIPRRLPLLAGADPFAGSLLSWDASGFVHELVAGEPFAGICTQSVRRGGYATDGAGFVDAMTGQLSLQSLGEISGIDDTDVAAATPIYASDDQTLTETATSNTLIGLVAGIEGSRVRITATTIDAAGLTAAYETAAATSADEAAASASDASDSADEAAASAASLGTIPALPGAGTFTLKSVEDVLTWVEDSP